MTPLAAGSAEALDSIRGYLEAWERSGGAGVVHVAREGVVLLHEPYGLADRENRRQMARETGFDIGSLVKLFTAAAILELEADGLLSRSDSLGRFFPRAPAAKAEITLEEVLRHTSGLPDIVDSAGAPVEYTPELDYEPVTRGELVERAFRARLRFRPGQREEYSNLGYGLLAVVIELTAGASYEHFVRSRLLEPAGMTRTGYMAPGWTPETLAVGYQEGERWGTPLDRPWLEDGPSWFLRGAGGMLAPVADLYRWVEALETGRVLVGPSHEAFLDLHLKRSPRGTRVLPFAGSNGIFWAVSVWDLDERLVVSVATSVAERPASELASELVRPLVAPARDP